MIFVSNDPHQIGNERGQKRIYVHVKKQQLNCQHCFVCTDYTKSPLYITKTAFRNSFHSSPTDYPCKQFASKSDKTKNLQSSLSKLFNAEICCPINLLFKFEKNLAQIFLG